MLGLLKKYQKVFFIFVAALVGFSVMFVGLLPRNLSNSGDKTLFRTVNGKKIKRSHYEGLKALLTTNNGELLLYGQNMGMNFFPQDVLTENIIKPGIIGFIAEKKQDELASFWSEQQEKEKHFSSYAHPQMSHLSAESIWHRQAPEIPKLLEKIKGEKDLKAAFEIRTQLFLEESQFSSFALWQFLNEKQSQYQWIPRDETMAPYNLSLFGYRSFQDWFGEKMMDYVCQFVLQVSSLAKQKGYQASYKEAENSLLKMNDQCFKQLQFLGIKEFKDSESYFYAKLNRLGMNKMQMVSLWQEVLTFQNFFNEASHAALLDPETLSGFEEFATEEVKLARYSPPEYLKFKSVKDLAKFETYLTALGKPKDSLGLDFALHPLSDIEKENPQLVEQSVEIEYKEVNLDQAAIGISVQDIWSWKVNPKNTSKLLTKFPKLQINSKMSPSEYEEAFEEADYFTQMQMDKFVRQTILQEDPNWKSAAFERAELKKDTVRARKSGYKLPFSGLELFSEKKAFLKKFFSFEDSFIEPISFDENHFYQIVSVKALEEPKLVSYSDLLLDKTAEKMLHQALTKAHKEGSFKESKFKSVKDKVLKEYLAPIQSAVLSDYKDFYKKEPSYLQDSFYCKHRLFNPMREALSYYKEQSGQSAQPFNLNSFWEVKFDEETLIRHQNNNRELDSLLAAAEGDWSEVNVAELPTFSQVLSKTSQKNQHPMQKQLRAEFAREAISELATELLDQIELKSYSNPE